MGSEGCCSGSSGALVPDAHREAAIQPDISRHYRLQGSATGLDEEWSIVWSDVRAIHAYKVDLFTVDQILNQNEPTN